MGLAEIIKEGVQVDRDLGTGRQGWEARQPGGQH